MRRSCLALFCLTFAALLNGCSGSGGGSGGGSFSNAKWAAVLQPATFPAPLIELGMNFTQEGESISSGNSTSIINFGDCLIDDGELTRRNRQEQFIQIGFFNRRADGHPNRHNRPRRQNDYWNFYLQRRRMLEWREWNIYRQLCWPGHGELYGHNDERAQWHLGRDCNAVAG